MSKLKLNYSFITVNFAHFNVKLPIFAAVNYMHKVYISILIHQHLSDHENSEPIQVISQMQLGFHVGICKLVEGLREQNKWTLVPLAFNMNCVLFEGAQSMNSDMLLWDIHFENALSLLDHLCLTSDGIA